MSEVSAAWKLWTSNPCWDELLNICEDLRRESIADEDRVPTAELDVAIVAECRGIRLGLKRLIDRVEEKL